MKEPYVYLISTDDGYEIVRKVCHLSSNTKMVYVEDLDGFNLRKTHRSALKKVSHREALRRTAKLETFEEDTWSFFNV